MSTAVVDRIPVRFEHLSRVVAGLVPATSIVFTLCLQIRGRRDKPGDDAASDSKRPKSALGASPKCTAIGPQPGIRDALLIRYS